MGVRSRSSRANVVEMSHLPLQESEALRLLRLVHVAWTDQVLTSEEAMQRVRRILDSVAPPPTPPGMT